MAWTHLFDSDDAFASNLVGSIGSKNAPAGTANVANNTTLATGVGGLSAGTILIDCTPTHSYTGSALETYAGLTKDSGTDQKIWYDGNSTTRRFAASSRLNFGTTRSMSEPSLTHASNATVQARQVLALAWDTAGASFYRNGVLVSSSSTTNTAPSGTATLKVGPLSDLVSALPVRSVALANHRLNDTDLASVTSNPDAVFYSSGEPEGASFEASGGWVYSGAASVTTRSSVAGSGAWSYAGAAGFTTRARSAGAGSWSYSGEVSVATRSRFSASGGWGYSGSASLTAGALAPDQDDPPASFEASGAWAYLGSASVVTRSLFAASGAWNYSGLAALGVETVPPSKSLTLAPMTLTLAPVQLALAPVELRL